MIIADMPIRHIVSHYRGADEVFRRFKIDFYRIGSLTLLEAAKRQRLDLTTLKAAMSELAESSDPALILTRDLIVQIRKRQNVDIPNLLFKATQLAHGIEDEYANTPACPQRLGRCLKLLAETLTSLRSRKDETINLKMLRASRKQLRFPILRLMLDNDELSDQLDTIARLTNDFTAPEGANANWQSLNKLCALIDGELRFQMHLENNLLFPRFVGPSALAA